MNKLVHLAEFQKALADYQMSETSKKTLKKTNLVLLVAPTSAGRNTIINELQKTGDYHYIVSDTTREPRINDGVKEENGQQYWFKDEATVLQDLRAGKYLEAAVIHAQQVSGISIHELEKSLKQNKIAITDIEIKGSDTIMSANPDVKAIFVLPPNFDEWMHRLKHRGKLSKAEIKRRLESALSELTHALEQEYYTFIVNNNYLEAAEKIHQFAKLGIKDSEEQKISRRLAEELYISTQAHLRA